jgi:hypothetical protein
MYGSTLLRHEATVTPYLGDTGIGEAWDDDSEFTLKCRFSTKRRVLRSSRGDEILADASLICRSGELLAEKDKVTRDGRTYLISEIRPAEGPHSGTNHLDVLLSTDG